jgi:Predicted membrane protein
LIPRVLVVSAAFNAGVALQLLPMLVPPFVIGLALATIGWSSRDGKGAVASVDDVNPLRLGAALRMGIAFQIAMVVITLVQRAWGTAGIYTTAGILGLTDMDALTVSMSRPDSSLSVSTAARAIAIGILFNTLLKLAVAVGFGRLTFRRRAAVGLVSLAAASAVGLLIP